MKILDRIPYWLKSKYLITLSGFALWMVFFDDRDVVTTHFRHTGELKALRQSKSYYEEQIVLTRKELDQLKQNAATIEKYAREKYLMKRDNEDLFIVSPK
ncbi:MAG: septum formation initiator family protein [Chitinophagaceae bacterium]